MLDLKVSEIKLDPLLPKIYCELIDVRRNDKLEGLCIRSYSKVLLRF